MPDGGDGQDMQEDGDFWISTQPPAEAVTASVVIPSYAAERTLMRAADSALGQSLRDIELIIVDDASPDLSWPMITELMRRDRRVRAIRNKTNRGKSVSMNRAFSVARGRWLAVLDADDWYHPDRLETLIGAAERSHVEMVADNQYLYDASADVLAGTAWPAGDAAWRLTFDDFLLGSDAYESFNLGMLKPVLKVDFIREASLHYEDKARQGEDFFHLLQFYLRGGEALICDSPFYYYTQPYGSISREWSHPDRTRYDFQNAYEISRRYIGETAGRLTRRQRRRLLARMRRLKVLECYFQAKDAAAERRWLDVALTLAAHPAALLHLIRRLNRRLRPASDSPTIRRIAAHARRRPIENDHAQHRGQ